MAVNLYNSGDQVAVLCGGTGNLGVQVWCWPETNTQVDDAWWQDFLTTYGQAAIPPTLTVTTS